MSLKKLRLAARSPYPTLGCSLREHPRGEGRDAEGSSTTGLLVGAPECCRRANPPVPPTFQPAGRRQTGVATDARSRGASRPSLTLGEWQ